MTVLDRAFIKAFSEGATTATASDARSEGAIRPPRYLKAGAAARATPGALSAASALHHPVLGHERSIVMPNSTPRARMAPLSAFSSQPTIEEAKVSSIETGPLEWPTACVNLLAQASRAFNTFAEHLIERAGQGQKSIALASCRRGEGRTTVSLALAKHLAGLGLQVLVIDADFEHPALVESCGVSTYTGWNQVVETELSWGESLVAPADEGVTLMPWRKAGQRKGDWLESAHAAMGFAMLRGRFDLIVVDTAPLDTEAAVADIASLAHFMPLDSVYLVQDMRCSGRDALAKTCEQLKAARVHVEGILENFVAPDGPTTAPDTASSAAQPTAQDSAAG